MASRPGLGTSCLGPLGQESTAVPWPAGCDYASMEETWPSKTH